MTTASDRDDAEDRAALPIAKAMVSYVGRIKMKSRDLPRTAELRRARGEMLKILIDKGIDTTSARTAVDAALDAAYDHRLARLRLEELRTVQLHSLKCLDRLIVTVEKLVGAVSALPPSSKGDLNLQLGAFGKEGYFDTEIFFDLIDRLLIQLPKLSPRATAFKAFGVIASEAAILRGSWEAMPASTRFKTERKIETLPSKTGLELLGLLPRILNTFRPPKPMGAPPSLDFRFVCMLDRIWLKLRPQGRGLKGRHADGPFHRFCNAAFMGVGNAGQISSASSSRA